MMQDPGLVALWGGTGIVILLDKLVGVVGRVMVGVAMGSARHGEGHGALLGRRRVVGNWQRWPGGHGRGEGGVWAGARSAELPRR